jgi:hypothetical protein
VRAVRGGARLGDRGLLDTGDDALSNDKRPAFDAMLNTLRSAGAEIPRVVLVHDWDRLTRDREACGLFTRRVLQYGGWVETCRGEKAHPRRPLHPGRVPHLGADHRMKRLAALVSRYSGLLFVLATVGALGFILYVGATTQPAP